MSSLLFSLRLALADYRHEALLSACSVFILAAVIAPLMVLLGVQHGIISGMTERLVNDPGTLEVIPSGSGFFGPDWFEEVRALPRVAFVVPQTRSIAATMNLLRPGAQGLSMTVTPLTATGPGDPLLRHWQAPDADWSRPDPGALPTAGVILSDSSARKSGVKAGEMLEGRVDRVYKGRRESAGLTLRVLEVLPPEARDTDMAYVPLELLVATEDYRDGRAVPFLGWGGDEHEGGVADLESYARQIRGGRQFASFRLYARGLDDVAPLGDWFHSRHVEVYVQSAQIELVRNLDWSFTAVFSLITGAAVFGFCASTAGNALAGVRRKSRSLGIMRLIGFPRSGILLFPVVQTVTTGLLGFTLAYALYFVVAYSIDTLFADSMPGGQSICVLPPGYAAAVFGVVIVLSALASLSAAWQADTIEPSEVIRDV